MPYMTIVSAVFDERLLVVNYLNLNFRCIVGINVKFDEL